MKTLILLVIVFSQASHAVEVRKDDECEAISLEKLPYASSYLPLIKNEINTRKGIVIAPFQVSPDIKTKQQDLTLLERYYGSLNWASKTQDAKIPEALKSKFSRAGAQSWEGFCHQWAAAALDPKVRKYLDDVGFLICGNFLLSGGDLRELMTAFYSGSLVKATGERKYKETLEGKIARQFSGSEANDFDPDIFFNEIKDTLRQDKGVVVEMDPGAEVWNFPVFAAGTCAKSNADLSIAEGMASIPRKLFVGRTQEMNQLLDYSDKIKKDVEIIFKPEKTDRKLAEIKIKEICEWRKKAPSAMGIEAFWSEIPKDGDGKSLDMQCAESLPASDNEVYSLYLNLMHKGVMNPLEKAIKDKQITLKNGYTSEYKTAVISFVGESAFGEGQYSVPQKTTSFAYFTITDNKGRKTSYWARGSSKPDFLWHPNLRANKETSDLLALADECFTEKEVGFANLFYESLKDNEIDEAEAKVLAAQFENLDLGSQYKSAEIIQRRYPEAPGVPQLIATLRDKLPL